MLLLLAAIGPALPAAASRETYLVDPSVDPVAQLTEMLGLYEDLCLNAFPDDVALARRIAVFGDKAQPISGAALADIFHGDPGLAWVYRGRSSRFTISVEAPPFHACAVRATTKGFKDLSAYRALADRYERRVGGFRPFERFDRIIGTVHSIGLGEQKDNADGSADALMFFAVTPVSKDARETGTAGIEVRFVHQMASPGAH